ncbi:MAG: C40 family peptidase [Candidatus Cohnella colombiensis]|uniref:C40 family peptidase n=1 Tax=Candidatus Cohnella colombiensis TaxID=3121368 RepID=A0AA95EX53_9BACL|nr:MAG: C40 family peptidase [Cohnella sp.]
MTIYPIWKKTLLTATCLTMVLSGSMIVNHTQTAAAATTQVSSSTSKAKKMTAIVNFAKSLQGKVTYKFGVNNPSRYQFDCSSFTKYVFASQGISLKWGSSSQSKQGVYVSKSNLKAGDLIFFSVSTKGKINHVGIYMGNGKFIHNTTGSKVNGVVISNLSSYTDRYITARRVS